MNANARTGFVLTGITLVFLTLSVAFLRNLWGHPASSPPIPLVDAKFIDPAPSRVSVADNLRAGGSLLDYDCYACHERNKPLKLKLDSDNNIILPKEHNDILMGHGGHKRNNNCFNCHDETNLELLQTRDGRQLKLTDRDLSGLCGSCHGPTYRDWEAGVHGRTSGFWDRELGEYSRLGCPSCHDPHSPKFPSRPPAPGPYPLHPIAKAPAHTETEGGH